MSDTTLQSAENVAPEGSIWVCLACGRTAQDKYGEEGGWDESCMLNSRLHRKDDLVWQDGRVIRITGENRHG